MATASLVSNKADQADQREAFAAFVCDEVTAQLLHPVAAEHGWASERIQTGGIANAVRSLTVMTSPEFLIVDLSESEQPRADISALAEVCEPGTVVLALGTINDVALYRELIGSGIHDYLVKPIAPEVMRDAIAHAEAVLAQPIVTEEAAVGATSNRMCAFIGVRGGVGASTIASSCCWIMAHELDRQVALLDLDLHFGTDALVFDLEPGRGLCDALENPGRVDGLFIERAMIKECENLSILGAEAPINESISPDPAALSHLQSELKQNFEIVVMDIPRSIVANHPYLLSEATDIVVITDLSLAATRDTIRLLAFIQETAPGSKLTLVANKVASGANVEVSQKDFEASIERKIDWSIPLDSKSAILAAKKGKILPQAAGSAKPVALMRDIAKKITGVKDGKKKKSFLSQLKFTGKK